MKRAPRSSWNCRSQRSALSPRCARGRSRWSRNASLIIEDNADAADALRGLLRECGHLVISAANGENGIEAFAKNPSDIVICDIGLPGTLDGYAVARELRKMAGDAHLRLIALSGYGQDQNRKKATEAGFDHYFTKTIGLDQLERVLGGGGLKE